MKNMDLINPGIAKGGVHKIGALDIHSHHPLTRRVLTLKKAKWFFLFCQFIFAGGGKKTAKTKKNLPGCKLQV